MWTDRVKLAVAAVPAIGVATAIITLWHDAPRSYDVALRTSAVTAYVRVTPWHSVLGGWRTGDVPADKRPPPIYGWEPLGIVSTPFAADEERSRTDRDFATASNGVRLGPIGYLHGPPLLPSAHEVMLPTWLACVVGVTPLALAVRGRRRRRQRVEGGRCLACGYDLRASTGRCPECGAAAGATDRPAAAVG